MECKVTIELYEEGSYTKREEIYTKRVEFKDVTGTAAIVNAAINKVKKALNEDARSAIKVTKVTDDLPTHIMLIINTLLEHPEGLSTRELTEITGNPHCHALIHNIELKYGIKLVKKKIPNYTGKSGNFGYKYSIHADSL